MKVTTWNISMTLDQINLCDIPICVELQLLKIDTLKMLMAVGLELTFFHFGHSIFTITSLIIKVNADYVFFSEK